MDSLLRWGIENSAPGSATPPQPRSDLDPGIIDHILGKPDAERMKEALGVALDEKRAEDDRVEALDEFEMLVENIDNANDVQKLKMWPSLQGLLTSSTTAVAIKTQTLWVIGTILQNNPAAQTAYMALTPLPILLSFISSPHPSHSPQARSKAVYALSGLLKHNALAVAQLEEVDGWNILRAALEDSDITVRRKVAFLLNSLLIPVSAADASQGSSSTSSNLHTPASLPAPAPVHANSHASMLSDPHSISTSATTFKALREHQILETAVSSLVSPTPYGPDGESEGDIDLEEKLSRLLYTYAISCSGQLPSDVKLQLRNFFDNQTGRNANADLAERWGLEGGELKALRATVE